MISRLLTPKDYHPFGVDALVAYSHTICLEKLIPPEIWVHHSLLMILNAQPRGVVVLLKNELTRPEPRRGDSIWRPLNVKILNCTTKLEETSTHHLVYPPFTNDESRNSALPN